MRFGILQRYVMGEVLRAFSLALLTITAVFVLLTVMAKASQLGLGPSEILMLVPYLIPSSLPYTIPVSLLFASTVVYGRLASDNEVIAVKTAGLSALVLIWPSVLLALVMSLGLSVASGTAIPSSTNMARVVITKNLEDMFYKRLKVERQVNFPSWPFAIMVKDVDGRIMKGATFKQKAQKPAPVVPIGGTDQPENNNAAYDMIVQATEATIKFDLVDKKIRIFFKDADISKSGIEPSEGKLKQTSVEFDIPGEGQIKGIKMLEEQTISEMRELEADYQEKLTLERKRQAFAASWYIASGRLRLIKWDEVRSAFAKFDYWKGEISKIETEVQMRLSMAWGSFFFVVLGAPVGMIFARRDFLSAFISCFMPIIIIYYPLMLFGVNLGKEGIIPPVLVWSGNGVLWALAWFFALPPVMKH